MRRVVALVFGTWMGLTGAAASGGDLRREVVVNGETRIYLEHRPELEQRPVADRRAAGRGGAGEDDAERRDAEPMAVVLAFHGSGGRAETFRRSSGLNRVADRHGFVVIYPEAGDGRWGTHRRRTGDPSADLALVDAILDRVAADPTLDAGRVFATGMSNGGDFSFLLGLCRPDRINAVAPVAINLSEALVEAVEAQGPVAVINIVGDRDPLVPYADSRVGPGGDRMLSSAQTLAFWSQVNRAGPGVTRTLMEDVEDDGTTAVREDYAVGPGGRALTRVTVMGGGHAWPGGSGRAPERMVGKSSRDFDAGEVIWDFFSQQPRLKVARAAE